MQIYIKIIFIISFTICRSQTYKPLLDTNNQWNFTTCNFGCITDTYFTNGDTIANGLAYKILDGYHYQSRTFLLREDTSSKRVYFGKVNSDIINETLLYDFSLNEGAVISVNNPSTPFSQNGGQFVLDSIRMKPLVNNVNFKHFFLSPLPTNTISSYPIVWIEGIGSKSLINAPGGLVNIDGVGELICFFKNENLVYSKPEESENCLFLNLSTTTKKENAFHDLRIINSENNNIIRFSQPNTIREISVTNILGKNINFNKSGFEKTKTVDLQDFVSGIFFIIVTDFSSRQKTFKVIIQN